MHAALAIRATIGCWTVVLACAVGSGCGGTGLGEPGDGPPARGAFGLTARDGIRAVVADTNGRIFRGPRGLFTGWSRDGPQMAVTSGTASHASVVVWRWSDPGPGGTDAVPRWSPDGSHLAFLRIVRYQDELPLLRLMTVSADGAGGAQPVPGAPVATVGFNEHGGHDWRPPGACRMQ